MKCFQCSKCGKSPSTTGDAPVNTSHPQFPVWVKKGIKSFCWRCMKNTKQVIVEKS